jgi:ABC-type multidrug transport system fused ATPase/permease subunit
MKTEYILNKYLSDLSIEDAIALDEGYKIDKKKPFILRKYSSYNLYFEWREKMLKEHGDGFWEKLDEARSRYRQRMEEISEERKKIRASEIEKERKDLEKQRKRAQKLKNIWIPIVKWTQVAFNILLTIIIMVAISLIINAFVVYFNLSSTLYGLKNIGIALLILGSIIGLVLLVRAYILYLVENEIVPIWLKPFISFFKYIGKNTVTFFSWISKGFGKFFGLFWEYFKANKNDYCPAINWDDEEK